MSNSTILNDVKSALRISSGTTAFSTEINDLIDACKADLGLSGVTVESAVDTDALIKRAIITYCKANFGFNNPDADRFNRAYELLKQHLSLTRDYARYTVTFTITNTLLIAINDAQVTFNGETKTTNASGKVVFYTRPENALEYSVSAEDYQSYPESDDDVNDADITTNTAIAISLTAVGS